MATSYSQLIPATRLTGDVYRSKFVGLHGIWQNITGFGNEWNLDNVSFMVTAKSKIELPK